MPNRSATAPALKYEGVRDTAEVVRTSPVDIRKEPTVLVRAEVEQRVADGKNHFNGVVAVRLFHEDVHLGQHLDLAPKTLFRRRPTNKSCAEHHEKARSAAIILA